MMSGVDFLHLLYSEQDLITVRAQKKRRLLAVLPFCLIALSAGVAGFCTRLEWLAILGFCALAVILIFWLNFMYKPVCSYEKLICAALSGRYHDTECLFSAIEPDVSLINGISFRSVVVLGSADKHGIREHQYYLDTQKDFPDLAPETAITIRYNDRNIIGYQL